MTTVQLNAQEIAVKNLLVDANVVVIDGDPYRILSCEDSTFTAELEDEFSEPFTFEYNQVDLSRDLIYKLMLVN
jgi:hypothetical protein